MKQIENEQPIIKADEIRRSQYGVSYLKYSCEMNARCRFQMTICRFAMKKDVVAVTRSGVGPKEVTTNH